LAIAEAAHGDPGVKDTLLGLSDLRTRFLNGLLLGTRIEAVYQCLAKLEHVLVERIGGKRRKGFAERVAIPVSLSSFTETIEV
jgi:hypothetical protein